MSRIRTNQRKGVLKKGLEKEWVINEHEIFAGGAGRAVNQCKGVFQTEFIELKDRDRWMSTGFANP